MAHFGYAPDIHIVRPLGNVEIADFFARHQRRGRPANISGFDAVLEGLGEIDLDFNLRYIFVKFHMQVYDALDLGQNIFDMMRSLLEDVQVVAIDAHDDGFGGPGKHLPDSLFQIGLHIAVDSRIAVYNLLNFVDRGIIVNLGVHADPIFPEVHADDLIHDQGLPDVRTEVSDPRD